MNFNSKPFGNSYLIAINGELEKDLIYKNGCPAIAPHEVDELGVKWWHKNYVERAFGKMQWLEEAA